MIRLGGCVLWLSLTCFIALLGPAGGLVLAASGEREGALGDPQSPAAGGGVGVGGSSDREGEGTASVGSDLEASVLEDLEAPAAAAASTDDVDVVAFVASGATVQLPSVLRAQTLLAGRAWRWAHQLSDTASCGDSVRAWDSVFGPLETPKHDLRVSVSVPPGLAKTTHTTRRWASCASPMGVWRTEHGAQGVQWSADGHTLFAAMGRSGLVMLDVRCVSVCVCVCPHVRHFIPTLTPPHSHVGSPGIPGSWAGWSRRV
jgi:hypothetical protein